MSMTMNTIKKIFNIPEMADKDVEEMVSKKILETPYKKVSTEKLKEILYREYQPGFFKLSEVKNTAFIREHVDKIFDRIENKELNTLIAKYPKVRLYEDIECILRFKQDGLNRIEDIVTLQERDDVIRKIIYLLLTGDPNYSYNAYEMFNLLAVKIVSEILNRTEDYSFHDRLKQSIVGGLIGVNLKDKLKNIPNNKEYRYCLPYNKKISIEENIDYFDQYIEQYNKENKYLTIDFFKDYKEEVIYAQEKLKVCWITDDYLETLFQLKFIEEQMDFNKNLLFYIIPRFSNNYANDISFWDIYKLLKMPIFSTLKKFYLNKRLIVCETGFDQGMFNGFRLSESAAQILLACDKVVISGCRSFETGQDIKKDVFYTGLSTVNKNSQLIIGGKQSTAFVKCKKHERAYGNVSYDIYNRDKEISYTTCEFAKEKGRLYGEKD